MDLFINQVLSGIATGSQTRWTAINPWGVPVEDTAVTNQPSNRWSRLSTAR